MATFHVEVGSYTIIGSPSAHAFSLGVDSDSYAITGTVATLRGSLHQGLLCDHGVYTLTGVLVQIQRLLVAPAGYIITGTAATLTKVTIRRLDVASGSYTYTGGTTILQHSVGSVRGIYTITGTVATLSATSLPKSITAVSGSYTYTGSTTVLQAEINMGTGDYNVTGTIANLRKGKSLQALSSTYTLNGQPTILAQSRHFPSAEGIYTYTGFDQTLQHSANPNKFMILNGGTYNITGFPSLRILSIQATSGTYTLSGTGASLAELFTGGTYDLTGTAVSFVHLSVLGAESGTYDLSGRSINSTANIIFLTANAGVYSYFGFSQGLSSPRVLAVDPGVYSFSGTIAGLFATRISSDEGLYVYTGFPANLQSSHTGRWRKQPARPPRFTKQTEQSTTWDQQPTGPGVL